jgi:transcriptional regulator GlxA family with amidase domain
MSAPHVPVRVATVVFDGISPFHLAVPCVVFGQSHPGVPAFAFRVCGLGASPLSSAAGFSIAPSHGLESLAWADWIIVPSWPDELPAVPETLRHALLQAHGRGALIVGLCLGAFVLADAGLLDGRRATTHWAYADDFKRRFPQVVWDSAALQISLPGLITSAGTAAALDCCLHLVRQHCGATVANHLARRLVVAPLRHGDQSQFVELAPSPQGRDGRLVELLTHWQRQLHEPMSLETMAGQAHMSTRQFSRRFRAMTGQSPGQWLIHQRLLQAQQWLEASRADLQTIAQRVGFGSAVTLREHFRRHFGIAPSQWRAQFFSAVGDEVHLTTPTG